MKSKHRTQRWFIIAVLLITCALLCPKEAIGRQKAEIINAKAWREGNNWLVAFSVSGSFTEKMENAILSGIPTTFTFHFTLYRDVEGWTDERVFSWKVRRTIRFDNLKRSFEVVLDNEGNKKVFTDFTEAKTAMITFKKHPLVVAASLSPDKYYYVKVMAELDKVDLPMVLDQVFFFVSLWDFKTTWKRIDLGWGSKDSP